MSLYYRTWGSQRKCAFRISHKISMHASYVRFSLFFVLCCVIYFACYLSLSRLLPNPTIKSFQGKESKLPSFIRACSWLLRAHENALFNGNWDGYVHEAKISNLPLEPHLSIEEERCNLSMTNYVFYSWWPGGRPTHIPVQIDVLLN